MKTMLGAVAVVALLLGGCGIDETTDISINTFKNMLAKANADFLGEKARLRDRLVGYDPDEPTSTAGGSNGSGTNGSDGSSGVDGSDGAEGAKGDVGPVGPAGVDGARGFDGRNGTDGTAGADGRDGVDGTDGRDGTDGVDGESCSLKRIDKKYVELTCPNSDPILIYSKLKKD